MKSTIQLLVQKIPSIKAHLQHQKTKSTKDKLNTFENQLTLDEILNCISTTPEKDLHHALKTLLAHRWERIRNTTMCYTHAPQNEVNLLCLEIAKLLSPTSPYCLLMPTLKNTVDVYGTNVHNYQLHEFIVSDDGQLFVPIVDCFEHVSNSSTGQWEHVVSLDGDVSVTHLSPNEIHRLKHHSNQTRDAFEAINNLNRQRVHGENLGAQLQQLQNTLILGGEHGYGEDYDAHAVANVGIVKFVEYWDNLPSKEKQDYLTKYPSLAISLRRLRRTSRTDYEDAIHCVEMIARAFDFIIPRINSDIPTLQELQQTTAAQKAALENAMKYAFIRPLLDDSRPSPNVLTIIQRLSNEKQQAIFQNSQDAWMYALEHDSKAISQFKQDLSEKLKASAKIARFKNGATPLFQAISHGNLEAVRFLVEDIGVNVHDEDNDLNTALMWAVTHAETEMVKYLLEKGANLQVRNKLGENVIDLALKCHPELLKPLILKAVKLTPFQQEELFNQVPREVPKGMQKFAFKSVLDFTLIKQPEIFKEVLEEIYAQKDQSVLELDHGITFQLSGTTHRSLHQQMTPLMLAIVANNKDAVSLLLEKQASVDDADDRGATSLMWAVLADADFDIFKTILDANPKLNIQNIRGYTVLMLILFEKRMDLLPLFLKKNVNIFLRNQFEENALDIAREFCPQAMEPLLKIAITADLNTQKEFLKKQHKGNCNDVLEFAGLTYKRRNGTFSRLLNSSLKLSKPKPNMLLYAVLFGTPADVQQLLLQGIPVNTTNEYGSTALILAIKEGRANIIPILLKAGASLLAEMPNGDNALDVAFQIPHPEIIEHLLTKAASLSLANQEKCLAKIHNGLYKNVFEYVMIERPVLMSKFLHQDTLKTVKTFLNQMDFQQHYEKIRAKWKDFEVKAELNPKKYQAPRDAAKKLCHDLAKASTDLYLKKESLTETEKDNFRKRCIESIHKVQPVLNPHRGWKQILSILLIALTFPISLPLYAAGIAPSFFAMQTDSCEKLEAMENALRNR